MIRIRNWASALCLVLLSLSSSNSQTVDPTTGNLINTGSGATGTTSTWNNGVYVNQLCFHAGEPGNCGPRPSIRDGSNINFSYGQTDLNQIVNINRALAAGGTGVQLSGFNFGFMAKNGNGWDDGRQDYLSAYVKFYNAAGGLEANYDYTNHTNQKYNWTQFNFSETFASPIAATNYSNAQVGFIGKDNNFWAGNYGPEIYNVSFSLKYRVDPCITNPAYAPTCAGFKDVLTTGNLVPNPTSWNQNMNQAYAVNTALQNAGVGATVHGITYGFDWHVGGSQCTSTILWIFCDGWTNSSVNVNVSLTNSSGQQMYGRGFSFSGENTGGSVNEKYLFPASINQNVMGVARITSSGFGDSAIGNLRSSLIYTADPCAKDPLYSSSCTGYGAALAASLSKSSATTSGVVGPASVSQQESNTSGAPVTNVGGAQLSATGAITAPDNIPQTLKDVQAIAQQSQASAPPAAASSGAQQQQSNKSTPNMSLIMSLIGQIQAADRATQAAAVQNAQQVAATSAANAQEQAIATVDALNTMSAASSQATQDRTMQSLQTSIAIPQQVAAIQLQGPTTTSLQSLMSISVQSSNLVAGTTPIEQIYQPMINATSVFSMSAAYSASKSTTYNEQQLSSLLSIQQPVAETAPVQFSKIESRSLDVDMPVMPATSTMSRGTSITEIVETRANIETAQTEQQTETVKKNVQPNELAGGVDIASIATQPKGFDVYSITVMKDGTFYAPKDIYGNQKTIDNARALRSLSSDRLHQEMVDQQYKLGN